MSRTIAEELLKEIRGRLGFLDNVGLHYLSLDRAAPTLVRRRGPTHPAGEPGRGGPGRRPLYPRRALHRPAPARQRPPDRHAGAPSRPRQHGRSSSSTTRITMRAADHLVDFGPGPGVKGGRGRRRRAISPRCRRARGAPPASSSGRQAARSRPRRTRKPPTDRNAEDRRGAAATTSRISTCRSRWDVLVLRRRA